LVQTDEERKAKQKEYNSRPEVKAKQKAHKQTPEYKAKRKAHDSRPEEKAKKKAYNATYRKRPEVKAYEKSRGLDPKRKAYQKKLHSRPDLRKRYAKTKKNIRMQVLQTYSKRLSNSDVPCCNCCNKNSHSDFLAIDHIAGRKQMDSEPELVKIGYSSKLLNHQLIKWIIENNFPSGFQILCVNCNLAKGMTKNNNQCPHESK
jgi:hypothetical protein